MATLVKIQGNAVFNGGVKFQVTGVDTPLTPSLSSITSNGFTLSWDQVQDAFEYQLDISTNSNFSSFVAGYNNTTVPTTSAVVTGLSPQTTYWARIRAVVASTNSASVSGTTLEATSTLTNGLLAFYKLSDLTDSSGNNRTLTNNGGVTFSAGKIGAAATFNGSNWLTVNPTGISGRNLSVFCWVKTSGNGYNFFVSADKSGEQWGNLMTQPGGTFWGEFFLDGSFFSFSSNTTINNDQWRHIGMTSNGNEIKLWVDGVSVATNDISARSGVFYNGITSIGSNWPGSFAQVTGQIDGAGIWSRALTSAEVTELYNAGNGLEIN